MEKILDKLNEGVQIVTVNARLARLIRNSFDRRMVDSGKEGWPAPSVVSLEGWFQIIWDNIWEEKKPYLVKLRSKVLWEKTISEDNTLRNIPFLNISDMAEEVWKAYEIFRTYRLPLREADRYSSKEVLSFAGWLRGYRIGLEDRGFIDFYDMRERVMEGIRVGEVNLPPEIILVGFQEVSPELVELIEAVKERGSAISFLPSDPFSEDWKTFRVEGLSDKISVRRYADMADEVSQCARWIRGIYAPDKRIGVVVPDLNKYRDLIDRELAAELDPASAFSRPGTQGGYNISLGRRLSEIPIVRSGLKIISLGGGKIGLQTIEYLIGNPYLHGAEAEFMERGRLVYRLREANYSGVSIAELSSFIVKNKFSLPMLAFLLDSLKVAFKEWRSKRYPPSRWGELFASLLKESGWGIGDERFTLGSDEYQAIEAWRKALSGFSTLDEVLGEIDYVGACRRLTLFVEGELYQPWGQDSAIQVLGLLESSGIDFNHLWIMGAVEGVIPAKADPNPFLPLDMQRQCRTPHSSPEREFEFAKKNISDLLRRGEDIVVSYPRLDDSVESRLSPFFTSLSEDSGETSYIEKGNRFIDLVRSGDKPMENIPDDDLRVQEEELLHIQGGTGIAKDQASCPFKSFAAHRLHAGEWPKVDLGFGAKERGTLIHSAMEDFWSKVKKQEALSLLYESGQLESRLKEAIETAFRRLTKHAFSVEYVALEKKRLVSLLSEWLEAERRRPPFEVAAIEKKREISINGLTICTKADRIDKTPDGGEILIDYKSGECSKNNWEGARPKEPQMMIYGMEGEYSAVAFAKIKRGETKFIGIAREGYAENLFLEAKEGIDEKSWGLMMSEWKRVVANLLADFMAGKAEVDPKNSNRGGDCDYCPYPPLCRKAELLV